jgi:hypothetical protein
MSTFDQLTKGVADGGLSRRDTLMLAFTGAAAAAMSAVGFGTAAAAPAAPTAICRKGCRGVAEYKPCAGCSNSHCLCFPTTSQPTRLVCTCYAPCSSQRPCFSNSNCQIGYFCSPSGCPQGSVCMQKCTSTC